MNNRILKFRVWDKKEKAFVTKEPYLATFYISDDGATLLKNCDMDDMPDEVELKNFIIQQFTGLKDKNGTEIFEGDIVYGELDLREFDEYGRQYTGDLFSFKGKIVYEGCGFVCKNADFPLDNYGGLEVVGNVFENKELLK